MNRPPLQATETMVGGERLAVLVWVLGENVLLGLARGRNVTQTLMVRRFNTTHKTQNTYSATRFCPRARRRTPTSLGKSAYVLLMVSQRTRV